MRARGLVSSSPRFSPSTGRRGRQVSRPSSARSRRTRRTSPREVLSICGSCHLRGGRSRATGRPYPNAFVAGDDLFADFDIDRAMQMPLDATDTHAHVKTRAVLEGKSTKTCVDCHRVHGAPERKDGAAQRRSDVCHY
jgi:cytochrome c553